MINRKLGADESFSDLIAAPGSAPCFPSLSLTRGTSDGPDHASAPPRTDRHWLPEPKLHVHAAVHRYGGTEVPEGPHYIACAKAQLLAHVAGQDGSDAGWSHTAPAAPVSAPAPRSTAWSRRRPPRRSGRGHPRRLPHSYHPQLLVPRLRLFLLLYLCPSLTIQAPRGQLDYS
jgi:hypothetical protein